MPNQIIEPKPEHQAQWQTLYKAYGVFYNRPLTDDVLKTVWSWLMDPNHVLQVRIALDEAGGVLGLMHFRAMPRPLHGLEVGFLDDIFVDPANRGSGLAEQMLKELAVIGKANDWSVIRWLTADDNYRARGLYDRVAKKTAWNLYEMPC